MINTYLDDLRPCPDGFVLAKTAGECRELICKHEGNINILSLDNDLGESEEGKDEEKRNTAS